MTMHNRLKAIFLNAISNNPNIELKMLISTTKIVFWKKISSEVFIDLYIHISIYI